MIAARTVCHWPAVIKTAVVQVANPSHQYVYLKRDTLLGNIVPVSVALNKTTGAIQADKKTTESTRNELRAALTKAFGMTTLTSGECAQVLELCTKHRGVFSLPPKEPGRCTLAEAEFHLEPGTRPVDKCPYRANPRVQETID